MNIYKLEYIKFEEEVNNEIYFLGYFTTYENTLKAVEIYSKMPGFKKNLNNFEIKEFNLSNLEKENIVFDVTIYYHNDNYSVEYFHCLGIYGDFLQAKNKLTKYEKLNQKIIENSIVYESFINKHTLDKYNISEGFNTE